MRWKILAKEGKFLKIKILVTRGLFVLGAYGFMYIEAYACNSGQDRGNNVLRTV